MSPLDHALYYASRGWRVIPIPPGYKHPFGIDRWQEKATTDPERIRRHWTKHPDHGIGIATGAESGLWVLDIDPDDGGDDSLAALEARHGTLPDTVEAITGGGGRHLVFAWPTDGTEIRNSASGVLGVGLDVRGVGGQFVVAPTIHPETHQAYAWEIEHDPFDGLAPAPAPAWLLEQLAAEVGTAQPRRERRERPVDGDLPGDLFAAQTTWADELGRDGWTLHSTHTDAAGGYYELWTRPGKTVKDGASASLYWHGSDVLKVFTSNAAPLRANETYTLFGYEAAMRHGGDHQAAARAIRKAHNAATKDAGTVRADDEPAAPVRLEVVPTPSPSGEEGGGTRRRRADIVHNGRQLDAVVAEATAALVAANEPPTMFVRAGQLARLRQDEDERPIIEGLRAEHARLALADAADWWRSLKDGGLTATSPPLEVATSVLARGDWPLPALAGVVELPVLRADGSFHIDHGYDPATRLYHWHRGDRYEPIPDTPSVTELRAAVELVDEMLCDFPWDTSADRANAWALLLTPLVRAIVGQVPMALIDAPEPGTGKGLLVKIATMVTTGRPAALMAWPASDEELEKKVTATLMAGSTVVVFDNVEGMIKSPTLAAVLTADAWQGRVLGRSEVIMVPNRATWAATGNNIDVGGDLARRCYRIRLDARQARPWLRDGFRHPDLEGWVTANRPRLLHALCTVVRSWWVAGRTYATGLSAMGGYSAWVRTVGGILDHAGVPGFLANLAEFHAQADREAQAWEAFLTQWSHELDEDPITVAELIQRMRSNSTLHAGELAAVLPDELAGYQDSPGFSKRLGRALRQRCGRHYGADGLHLVELPRDRRQVAIYSVTKRPAQLEAREWSEKPARDDSVTRDDATSAGFAGFFRPTPCEKTELRDVVDESYVTGAEKNPRNPQTRAPEPDDADLF